MAREKRKWNGIRAALAWLLTLAAVGLCVFAGTVFWNVPFFGRPLRLTLLGCDVFLAGMFVFLCVKYVRSL